MKKQIRIRDLCSRLHSRHYSDMEIENHTDLHPSPERIRQIAIAKLEQLQHQQTEAVDEPAISADSSALEKRNVMKKNTMRILIIAAAVCLMSVTAFAATNGLSYFNSIFGNSAATVNGDIQSPALSNANKDYKIGIESLLSDGYKTNIIVSFESLKGNKITGEPSELFSVQAKDKSGRIAEGICYSCKPMDEFHQGNQYFYRLEVSSLQSHLSSSLSIALNTQNTTLKIEVPVEHSTAAKAVKIDAKNYVNKNYCPENVQLSPLGVLVIGSEKKAKGSLPTIEILALMKDGSKEEMMSSLSFDTQENDDSSPVIGGGGAVIVEDGQQAPLVTQTMAERNPNGKIVSTGYFSRILDLKQVKSIIVDGIEYQIN